MIHRTRSSSEQVRKECKSDQSTERVTFVLIWRNKTRRVQTTDSKFHCGLKTWYRQKDRQKLPSPPDRLYPFTLENRSLIDMFSFSHVSVSQCLIDWCRSLWLTREISFIAQMSSKWSLISHSQNHSLLCLYYTAVQLLEDIHHEVDRYLFEMDQWFDWYESVYQLIEKNEFFSIEFHGKESFILPTVITEWRRGKQPPIDRPQIHRFEIQFLYRR